MILFRRERSGSPVESTLETDLVFDLGPAFRRQRACYAPWRPPIEVFETAQELVVRVEIGGLSMDAVTALVLGDELIIRGERAVSSPHAHRLYHESRVRYGPFEAFVRLPFPVDSPGATADYLDGFLTVNLPRLAATRVTARHAGKIGTAQGGGN